MKCTMTQMDENTRILNSVIEYIYETHRFPSCTEISRIADINKDKCLKLCKDLVSGNQLCVVFGGEGRSLVYVPYGMMQGLLRTQNKPQWVTKYSFKDEPPLGKKALKIEQELQIFDMFKRLLYTTDIPLEEAVAFTLNYLEFEDVVHIIDNPDNPDITLNHDGKKVLLEVEGTKKVGKKKKILQLEGWMKRELDTDKKADEIQGIYVVNHFRDTDPSSRESPLSDHAKEFMKRYQFKLFTTSTLFDIAKDVKEGKLSKQDAKQKVWEGDRID